MADETGDFMSENPKSFTFRKRISHKKHAKENSSKPLSPILLENFSAVARKRLGMIIVPVHSILIVDDDIQFGRLVKQTLSGMGHIVEQVYSPRDIVDLYDKFAPDIIFVEIFMADINGIELANWLSEKGFKGKLVLMTGHDHALLVTAQTVMNRRSEAKVATLKKPFSNKLAAARAGLDRQREAQVPNLKKPGRLHQIRALLGRFSPN